LHEIRQKPPGQINRVYARLLFFRTKNRMKSKIGTLQSGSDFEKEEGAFTALTQTAETEWR